MVQQETLICLDRNQDKAELHGLATGRCAVFSRRAPAKVTPNEDAAVVIPAGPDAGVLAVADGCGGMAGGERAARIAIESLVSSVKTRVRDHAEVSMRAAILDGIENAHRSVREMGTGAATTLSVVEVCGHTIRPFHVGDSMTLLVGNRGKLKLQTKSHSPVGYAVAAGVMDEQEALHHDERHLVSNVIGTEDTHIEIEPTRRLAPRDTLLIASDGLADNLHVKEIVEIIRKGDLLAAANRLVAVATERMHTESGSKPSKPDDLTVVLFRTT
jgi:serine/threonine protein phosphatase PrpC